MGLWVPVKYETGGTTNCSPSLFHLISLAPLVLNLSNSWSVERGLLDLEVPMGGGPRIVQLVEREREPRGIFFCTVIEGLRTVATSLTYLALEGRL